MELPFQQRPIKEARQAAPNCVGLLGEMAQRKAQNQQQDKQ
jgi:hypothetical protein